MKQLITFHGKPEVKEQLLAQLREHARLDEIIRGQGYWTGQRGCGVGCTVHSSDHFDYETMYGIPFGIARAEDTIFETLPDDLYKRWPIEIIEAIPVGVCLDNVALQYALWNVTDEKYGTLSIYRPGTNTHNMLLKLAEVINKQIANTWTAEEREAEFKELAYLADLAYLAYLADLADLADRAYLAYRADLADLAYRADLADLAYLADRADLADLADRAYLADRADRADLADLADRAYLVDRAYRAATGRIKLLELIKNAA